MLIPKVNLIFCKVFPLPQQTTGSGTQVAHLHVILVFPKLSSRKAVSRDQIIITLFECLQKGALIHADVLSEYLLPSYGPVITVSPTIKETQWFARAHGVGECEARVEMFSGQFYSQHPYTLEGNIS